MQPQALLEGNELEFEWRLETEKVNRVTIPARDVLKMEETTWFIRSH